MTNLICITGYTANVDCAHCGRALVHGVVTDGGTFGAQCFAKEITAPRRHYTGKAYRPTASTIIQIAKVVQRAPAHTWQQYGVSEACRNFEVAA